MMEKLLALAGGGSGGGGGSTVPADGFYVNGRLVDMEQSSKTVDFDDPWNQYTCHIVFDDGGTLDTRIDYNGSSDPPMTAFPVPVNSVLWHSMLEDDADIFNALVSGIDEENPTTAHSYADVMNTFYIDGKEVDNLSSTVRVEMSASGGALCPHLVFVGGGTIDAEVTFGQSGYDVPSTLKPFSVSYGLIDSTVAFTGMLPEVN